MHTQASSGHQNTGIQTCIRAFLTGNILHMLWACDSSGQQSIGLPILSKAQWLEDFLNRKTQPNYRDKNHCVQVATKSHNTQRPPVSQDKKHTLTFLRTGSANCSKESKFTTYCPTRHSGFPGRGCDLKEDTVCWRIPHRFLGLVCSADPLALCTHR